MAQIDTGLQLELEERLRFETLITDISALFISLPPEIQFHQIVRSTGMKTIEHALKENYREK